MVPGAEFTDRTRDVIQLGVPTGIEEDDRIVILVTAEAFEIRLPTVEWTMGAYGPALTSKLWRRPRVSVGLPAVADLIQGAIEVRWKQFRVCKYCGERFPPEHRHGNVCHGCAEKHQGIVH
jgi:hypothetical protein